MDGEPETATPSLQVSVNGVAQPDMITFTNTGGWDQGNWRDKVARVQLAPGHNTVTLTTMGTNGPNLSRLEVESSETSGNRAHQAGHVSITADNGYIMYVNGERIGAGGAALRPSNPRYDRDGWMHTDHWNFQSSCSIPTSYAVEGVDSEGIAAMILSIDHCGKLIVSNDQWKCSPFTAASTGADRTFTAVPEAMDWDVAQQYCKTHFSDLASIHNAEEQELARTACGDIVETDELPIASCTASSESGAAAEAGRGATDTENLLGCVDGTTCLAAGDGADPLAWGCCGAHGGRQMCPQNQPIMCLHAPISVGHENDAGAHDCEATEDACDAYGGTKAKQYGCEKAYDNVGVRDEGEWATEGECGGFIKLNFASPTTVCTMMFQQRW